MSRLAKICRRRRHSWASAETFGFPLRLVRYWMSMATQVARQILKMMFFLLPLLFHLPGTHGSHEDKEDFRFCADRNQTKKGYVHYGNLEGSVNIVNIVNSADGLNITGPFPPEHEGTWPLPDRLGSYRFCIFWFQGVSLFMLNYGNTKNYNLSKEATSSFYAPEVTAHFNVIGGPVLYNVSYAFDKGFHNISLQNAFTYSFSFTDSGKVGLSNVEKELKHISEELKRVETKMESPIQGKTSRPGNPFELLMHLESKLGQLAFQGENKTWHEGTLVEGTVWKIPSHNPRTLSIKSKIEVDKEFHGYEVILPKFIFEKPRHGRKTSETKVVQLTATSQTLFQDQNASQILGGKVIGISVGNTVVSDLPKQQRLSITFWHHPLPRNITPQCVFWDTDSNPNRWNESGCESVPGETQTICRCDHLTFFAVLMVSSPNVDPSHQKYLTLVTYVGCIISAVASLITIFLFLCSRKRQRDHIVYVHMNLLCAIFILDMSFLLAVPLAPTGGDMACKAGAMVLHFGVLACLTWMGIEGYSLYQLVIEVFSPYVKHFLLKLCLVGWGLPIFIVILVFLIDRSHYGPSLLKVYNSSETYTDATICWITKKEINNFLNLGFLSLVLFFNIVMLAVMVREILRMRHREHHWEYVVMLLGLSCVLGIPWGLAFLSFTSGTFQVVAVYLFTIINSFQGFLIFLWYLARIFQSHRSSSMQCTSSNSIKLNSNSTSI